MSAAESEKTVIEHLPLSAHPRLREKTPGVTPAAGNLRARRFP